MQKNTFMKFLPRQVRDILISSKSDLNKIQEIKIRIGKPIVILTDKGEVIVRKLSEETDIREMLEYISIE